MQVAAVVYEVGVCMIAERCAYVCVCNILLSGNRVTRDKSVVRAKTKVRLFEVERD